MHMMQIRKSLVKEGKKLVDLQRIYSSCRTGYTTLVYLDSTACSYVVSLLSVLLCMNALTFYGELFDCILGHVTEYNMFMIQSVVTYSALIWLLFRAWQTLWKPVPELIRILGIEVPESPQVSLAGIKNDSVTLHWSKPDPEKPVLKYFIQVNGLNVGETSRQETAITVTGLRPLHYYNIRVISVGPNNFQTGSLVIRLRTYGRNGRPVFDGNLDSENLSSDDTDNSSDYEPSDHGHGVCVEATALSEGLSSAYRDSSDCNSAVRKYGQRRNTGAMVVMKKSSQPTTSTESSPSLQMIQGTRKYVWQLSEQLEKINRERDKIATDMAKELQDFQKLFSEICRDKDEKKLILREKEEASEKLKKEVNHADRLNRQAQTRKSQKEKLLKEKHAERSKIKEDMQRWKKEIEVMKIERGRRRGERQKAEKKYQSKVAELNEDIKHHQLVLNAIDEEIRLKGSQIKQLEKTRKGGLFGGDDFEETRIRDEHEDHEWDITEKALTAELNTKSQQLREIETSLHQQQTYLSTLQHRNSLLFQGYDSSIDNDTTRSQVVVNSRNNRNVNSQVISPSLHLSSVGSSFVAPGALGSPSQPAFAPGPYIDMRNDSMIDSQLENPDEMTEGDYLVLTDEAPMSQTATSLLPSNIFADDDSPTLHSGPLQSPTPTSSLGNIESQSPSPSYPVSLVSSPMKSTHTNPLPTALGHDFVDNDRKLASPRPEISNFGSTTPQNYANYKGFRDLFLPQLKAKDVDEVRSCFGPLRSSQSSKFLSLSEEDIDVSGSKHRQIRYSSTWAGILHKTSVSRESLSEINLPTTTRHTSIRAVHDLLGASLDNPESQNSRSSSPPSRPVLSFDLPRPSTDSAPFGWAPAQDNVSNRNSPLSTDWSLHMPNIASLQQQSNWSSNLSKRASVKHVLDTAFLPRLANDDDDFLPPSEPLVSQSGQLSIIGAIGTRQSSTHQTVTPKLNPAAPAFQGFNLNTNRKDEKEFNREEASKIPSGVKHTPAENPSNVINNLMTAIFATDTEKIYPKPHGTLDCQNDELPSESRSSISSKEFEVSSIQQLFGKSKSSKLSINSVHSRDTSLFPAKASIAYSDQISTKQAGGEV